MSKLRKLPTPPSLLNFTQQTFINGDEFLSHLQIWFRKHVNIHKWVLSSENVQDGDFKRKHEWKGIRVKTTERDAHRDRQVTVNLLPYIKGIHFYDFSTEL